MLHIIQMIVGVVIALGGIALLVLAIAAWVSGSVSSPPGLADAIRSMLLAGIGFLAAGALVFSIGWRRRRK